MVGIRVLRLYVAVKVFVLVDGAADVSRLLSLGGELEHDLELQQAEGCHLDGGRGHRWGRQLVQV